MEKEITLSLSEYEELKKLAESKKDIILDVELRVNITDFSCFLLGVPIKTPISKPLYYFRYNNPYKGKLQEEDLKIIDELINGKILDINKSFEDIILEINKELEKIHSKWWYKLFS